MNSLRTRLTFSVGLTQAALLAVAAAAAWWLVSDALRESFDSGVKERALALATLVVQDGPYVELEFGDSVMSAYARGSDAEPDFFQVWIKGKGVLERSLWLRKHDAENLTLRAGPLDEPEFWSESLPDGRDGRFAGIELPIHEYERVSEEDGKTASRQTAVVVVGTAIDPLERSLLRVGIGLCLLCIAWILASTGAVMWAVGHGLRPVHRLAQRLARIGDPSERSALKADDSPRELAPIVHSTSDMLERIDELLQRERRFSGNVAHELRTPVSELRVSADVALLDPADHEGLRRAAEESQAIAVEMERTIATLLTLWRSDRASESAGRVSLADLVESQHELHHATAAERGVSLRPDERPGSAPEPPPVVAAHGPLQLVIGNLVRNAIEHGEPGTDVLWSAVENGAFVNFQIENSQTHLDPSTASRLFDAFWSDAGSRSRSSHSGLGLSLAKAICETEGWALDVEVTEDLFRVRLGIPKDAEPR